MLRLEAWVPGVSNVGWGMGALAPPGRATAEAAGALSGLTPLDNPVPFWGDTGIESLYQSSARGSWLCDSCIHVPMLPSAPEHVSDPND